MREFDWINLARERFGDRHDGVTVGIGDDCAVLNHAGQTLVSADTVVAGVHFDLSIMSYEDVGWRALAVALSDLAAGGVDTRRPVHALLCLQAPPDLTDADFQALLSGTQTCAQAHRCSIVGGDTVSTPGPLALSITVLGATDQPVLRRGAQPGNLIVVTGPLGAAGVGLKALREGRDDDNAQACGEAYRRPRARLEYGALLAQNATAMIDISDGLAQDLAHVCAASKLGAVIELEDVPVADATRATAAQVGLDPLVTAATFGDDYELIACIPPARLEWLQNQIPGLTKVGEMVAGQGMRVTRGGQTIDLPRPGYQHGS